MNGNNGQIRLVIKKAVERYPFYVQNFFSKKNWDSTFSLTEDLYAWNLSKYSKSTLPSNWVQEFFQILVWALVLINVNVGL